MFKKIFSLQLISSWGQGVERLDKTTVILGDAEDIVVVIHEQN